MSITREDYEHTAPLTVKEIEDILERHLEIEYSGGDEQSAMETIKGIHEAAVALADRILSVLRKPKKQPKSLATKKARCGSLDLLVETEFDFFWSAYPKRDGSNPKKPAFEKFRNLVTKHNVRPELLIDAAKALAVKRRHENPKFTPMAVTWLNQERWKDVDGPPNGGGHRGGSMLDVVEELEDRR